MTYRPGSPVIWNPQDAVAAFHRRTGQPAPGSPVADLDGARVELRARLVREEAAELADALEARDLAGAVAEAADVVYVALGALVELGVDVWPFFRAIHEANLAKAGGGRRADGKVLKPAGWRPADLGAVWTERYPGAPNPFQGA